VTFRALATASALTGSKVGAGSRLAPLPPASSTAGGRALLLLNSNLFFFLFSEKVEGTISHKNTALSVLALQNGFEFLDAEAMTRARLDAHVSEVDCSHYCQPGF
jgi:hypothetical protein